MLHYFRYVFVPVIALLAVSGCGPTLHAIEPGDAYPRQIVGLRDGALTRTVWDAGTAGERVLPALSLGSRYLQVPENATPGPHPVALRVEAGDSNSMDLNVLSPASSFPGPRIEGIGLFRRHREAHKVGLTNTFGGKEMLTLAISAANMDTDARILIDGVEVESYFWSAIPSGFISSHSPDSFRYPIYHYAQIMAVVDTAAFGYSFHVTVVNRDGKKSRELYNTSRNPDLRDSDGDGLLDVWETRGFTAADGTFVDLPRMGANPRRTNILVEVDWVAAAEPNSDIWDAIRQSYADAPVLNPDGSRGVEIILDYGQGGVFNQGGQVLADHTVMGFAPVTADSPEGYASFRDYKSANFNAARTGLFHYAVFGRMRPGGSSGLGEIVGDDFIVTFVDFGNWSMTTAQLGTFAHELGHNLGLPHGGILDSDPQRSDPWKPNLPSIMSYRYQFNGVSVDCNQSPDSVYTYSQGMMATIDENSVDESAGLCDGMAIDLDRSGSIDPAGPINANQDIRGCDCTNDGCDCDTVDLHKDYDQWGNLKLNFRSRQGITLPGEGE